MSARAFLDTMFSTCEQGTVEFRALPSGRRHWTTPGSWSSAGPWVTEAVRQRQNVHVGLATRRDSANGTEGNLLELPMVWADIDEPPAVVRTRLEGFPFRWSLLVASGYGCHAYWALREPLDVSAPLLVHRAASLLRRLAAYLGADDRCTSPAVTPRLPNSRNYKYAAPLPVTLLETTDSQVNPLELEDFLPGEIVRRNAFTVRSSIETGDRNNTLYALVRSLRARSLDFEAIDVAVRAVNSKLCDEPLDERELVTLLRYALAQPNRVDFVEYPLEKAVVHDAGRARS